MVSNPSPQRRWLKRLTPLLIFSLIMAVLGGGMVWLIQVDAVIWLARANTWLAETVIQRMGYLGVFLLMVIESSFIPFPSEIVIPPAGDLARRLPDWSLAGVIFWGTAGSLAGALINYWLAWTLGRPLLLSLIKRYGRYFRISEKDFQRTEAFLLRHGALSTLVGRLLPVIRQLISLPAGLAGMPLMLFCVLTSLGAGLWVAVLALAGYWFGSEPERLSQFLREETRWLIALALLFMGAYLIYWRRYRRGRTQNAPSDPPRP
ncbi:MAG: DedA family protein [Deltaproteobacteria bacterium]|nr:DedA family protein [Deltaproteobacteria bacterium]